MPPTPSAASPAGRVGAASLRVCLAEEAGRRLLRGGVGRSVARLHTGGSQGHQVRWVRPARPCPPRPLAPLAPGPRQGGTGGAWSGASPAAYVKLADLTEEIQTLKSLRHERLIRLHAVCSAGEPVYIVTELMRKGNLQAFLGSEFCPRPGAAGDPVLPVQPRPSAPFSAWAFGGVPGSTVRALAHSGLGPRARAVPCGGTRSVEVPG